MAVTHLSLQSQIRFASDSHLLCRQGRSIRKQVIFYTDSTRDYCLNYQVFERLLYLEACLPLSITAPLRSGLRP